MAEYFRYNLKAQMWEGLKQYAISGHTPAPPPTATFARGNTSLCLTYDEIGFTRAGAAADRLLLPAQVVHPLAAQAGGLTVRLEDAALPANEEPC
jgi:hypothetical protein